MKKLIILIVLIILLAAVFFVWQAFFNKPKNIDNIPLNSENNNQEDSNKQVENNYSSQNLDLDKKIGQLFIVGIKGKTITLKTEKFIKEFHPGGILLLSENIESKEQLANLIISLQEIAIEDTGLPLFIAVDQEGGLISRIKWADTTPQLEIKTKEEAYEIGKKRGKDLKDSLIDLNFSPLVDESFKGDFIFERTFQRNLIEAGEFAKEIIKGQKEEGIMSTIKHFPGYGRINFNPEDKLATLDKIPGISQFKTAAGANPEFIMVSNVVYKDFDQKLPFSFLKSGIDFLKQEIKGDYLTVSDDLDQYSLLNNFSLEDAVSKPFNAGIDVLIFSGWRKDPEDGINAFKEAARNNKISQERIDEAVLKITNLKLKNGKAL